MWCSVPEGIGVKAHTELALKIFKEESPPPIKIEIQKALEYQVSTSDEEKAAHRRQVIDRWKSRRREIFVSRGQKDPGGICAELLLELCEEYAPEIDRGFLKAWESGFETRGVIEIPSVFATSPELKNAKPEWDDRKLLSVQPGVLNACKKRANKFPQSEVEKVWNSLRKEVDEGFVGAPELCQGPKEGDVHLSRFGCAQPKYEKSGPLPTWKWRAIDDGKLSGLNRATVVRSVLVLLGVDGFLNILLFLVRLLIVRYGGAAHIPNVILSKLDHKSAYRQFRVTERGLRRVIVAKNPTDGRFYRFPAHRMLFGESACPTLYNGVAEVLDILCSRALRCPICSYFDDYAHPFLELDPSHPLHIREFLSDVVGTEFAPEKCEQGRKLVYLGLQVEVLESCVVRVSLSENRKAKLKHLLQEHLTSGHLTPSAAQTLAGKLSWACGALFGRVGRSYIASVFSRAYARGSNTKIGDELKESLEWWLEALQRLEWVRDLAPFQKFAKFIIYTDASEVGLGAVKIDTKTNKAVWFSVPIAPDQTSPVQKSNIAALEAAAVLIADETLGEEDSQAVLFIDNNTCLGSLVKGRSRDPLVAPIANRFWIGQAKKRANTWLERVASADNIADAPSRRAVPEWNGALTRVDVGEAASRVLKEFTSYKVDPQTQTELRV